MRKKFPDSAAWRLFFLIWVAESILWVIAVGMVHRGGALFQSFEPVKWGVIFLFTSLAIQAALLRPVWFAAAALLALRVGEFSKRQSLVIGYLFSVALTLVLSLFWPGEALFFRPKAEAPALAWFIGAICLAVAPLWLRYREEPIQASETTRGK